MDGDRESPVGALSNTRKTIPASRTPPVAMAIVFSFTQGPIAVLHMWERRSGGCVQEEEAREGFQYTVYSECIVTCVCCQVLLNYIFVCNVETNVSFLYGGTTGSEQSNL